ncbi:hypothetical protein HDU91_001404 [Kappamyces sp. JEL0680]|nr:hypothetical protein HDU91_001404 [Kappamyces sp. JEL0680]
MDAREELEELQEDLEHSVPFHINYVDIEDPQNKNWKIKYHLDIPVIHVQEKPAMMHGIDKQQLRALLENEKTSIESAPTNQSAIYTPNRNRIAKDFNVQHPVFGFHALH